VAQHYAWGDEGAIPRILGVQPDGRPWAEWWLGTHPGGPATTDGGTLLSNVSGELPYLVKLLAAAAPLSLQTHPDTATAIAGFEREEAAGLGTDHPRRVYRDRSAKPEVLIAITPFDALCGFRPLGDTEGLLHSIGADELASLLRTDGLEAAVTALYRRAIDPVRVVMACRHHDSDEARLVAELDRQYPADPSVVVTLFLNRVRLSPGEAIHLTPGNLHAYLHGVGVEVMGASDNVVRGGMTNKHVDVDELLRVLRFEPLHRPVIVPQEVAPGMWHYPTPGAPFSVTRLDVAGTMPFVSRGRTVVLCTEGDSGLLHHGEAAYLAPGEELLLAGPATVWAATEAPADAAHA
jgi:mannose-6-phosphate isomerase